MLGGVDMLGGVALSKAGLDVRLNSIWLIDFTYFNKLPLNIFSILPSSIANICASFLQLANTVY